MSLICVWDCPFSGTNPIPIVSARVESWPTDGDRTVFGVYAPITRYNPSPGVYYGYTNGPLWADNNHSQIERLYLPFIFNPVGRPLGGINSDDCIPEPSRTWKGKTINGIDLYGGKIELELCTNNLQLDQFVQMNWLCQWHDPEANDGRGSAVNYLVSPQQSICERLGYTPADRRAASGESRSVGWTSVTVQFPTCEAEEVDMVALDGRPDKVAAGVYSHSKTVRDAFACELLDMMVVFHVGQNVPTNQPTARVDGGFGELYVRKVKVWVDPVLNPNAVSL